jgi:ATP-dependent RNA helicase DeaD
VTTETVLQENNNGGATRYFVNIGSRDNFDWMSLKDYLKETLDLGRDDVFKVDVKEGSLSLTQILSTQKVMEIEQRTIRRTSYQC